MIKKLRGTRAIWKNTGFFHTTKIMIKIDLFIGTRLKSMKKIKVITYIYVAKESFEQE